MIEIDDEIDDLYDELPIKIGHIQLFDVPEPGKAMGTWEPLPRSSGSDLATVSLDALIHDVFVYFLM